MTLPVTFPIITALGLDPIWFGVALVIMIEIGLVTPPVGIILFILRGVSGTVALARDRLRRAAVRRHPPRVPGPLLLLPRARHLAAGADRIVRAPAPPPLQQRQWSLGWPFPVSGSSALGAWARPCPAASWRRATRSRSPTATRTRWPNSSTPAPSSAATPAAVAEAADVVLLSLPTPDIVDAVAFGSGGIAETPPAPARRSSTSRPPARTAPRHSPQGSRRRASP